MVLGRGAHHRGAADVDLLDRLCVGDARLGNRLAERVEVDDDEADLLDPELGDALEILGHVAAREDAPVDAGVQRLDATAEHLGSARHLIDRQPRNAGRFDLRARATRSDDLDVERMERAGEVLEPRGVGHADQRTVDAAHAALLVESGMSLLAKRRTTSGSNRCSTA